MINRFDKPIGKDWSWQTAIPKLPELDVAGFNEVLGQTQAQIDQASLLSEKKPQVLNNEEDLKLYQSYKQDVDKGLQQVAQAYSTSPTQGALAYKNYLGQIRKDWSPGGRADVLNQRYTGYQTALKETDEFYKTDSSPVNKTLAKQNLQSQLKSPIQFDPTTGKYTSIATPELYKNPDINKAVDEMLKEIKANGDTQFLGDENKSWWLQKIQTETREPERIKLAYQALVSQPEYASQIDRDTQYRALQVDPKKYQANFEATQNNALKQLTDINEKAKTDSNAAKQLQNLLRQEGYNISADGSYGPQTEKAAKEYLDSKKKDVQDNISKFDLNTQLRSDVDKGYMGYALRGAYEKKDTDLIFNQALKAQADIALKREENKINKDRLSYEFAENKQSQITVVDGVAQQLPAIQKYYEDTKTQRDAVKKSLDESLTKSKAFNGWNMENVAQAYDKWTRVTGATEEEKKANYKALLNQNGTHQFSDAEVQNLYEEMNAPQGQGALKTTLETYAKAQNEVTRIEDGQKQISGQYINTPEGKHNLDMLKGFRNPGESDVDFSNRIMTHPEQFDVPGDGYSVGYNGAEDYKQRMQKDLPKQLKAGANYNWGSLGTYEIYTGNKDETLKPTLDAVAKAVENGTGLNFSSFGKMGLNFKDNKGNALDDSEAKKVSGMAVTKDQQGNPILKVNITVTKPDGKTKDGYTEVALVPGSAMSREFQHGLINAYVAKVSAGENPQAQGILDNLDAIRGDNGLTQASIDLQLKGLNLNNTSDEGLMTVNPQTGQVVPISTLGWQSRNLNDDSQIGGRSYSTYGLNTPSGNYVANVVIDPATGAKVIVPGLDGSTTYSSSSGVRKDRLGKQILAGAPVIETKNKK